MTLELKFTGLTPEQALKLIGAATGAKAEINQNEPVSTAPIQPPIQAIPTAPAVTIPTAPPVTQPTAPATPIAPPTTPAPAVPPTTIPTTPPIAVKQYTADELAVAARPLCETPDGRDKLLNLLHSFSYTDSTGAVRTVQSIRDMPPEQYPALANGIRQLGGRI